jgi:hypothetical protein
MIHKNRKKLINFLFSSAGCSLLRAEATPIAWDKYIAIFDQQKITALFSAVFFEIWSSKPWIQIHLK